MGNYTKINLLLITIVSAFLMSFSSGSIKTAPVSDSFDYPVDNLASFSLASSPATHFDVIANIITLDDAASFTPSYKDKFVKLKKKYRRAIHAYDGIKQPIKQVEPPLLNIYSKETYRKPYFLPHLHQFLFRFTPF